MRSQQHRTWPGRTGALLALSLLGVLLSGAVARGDLAAAPNAEGPMCEGRSDAMLQINARAVGREDEAPKFILNLISDAAGHPSGTLVIDRGRSRLIAEDWCRTWRHLPGQEPGACDAGAAGQTAVVVHAVGSGHLGDGTAVQVRADARSSGVGGFFRVRYRVIDGEHGEHGEQVGTAEADDHGCGDDGWTRLPATGWYPLDSLRVRTDGS
ncbi:MAG: hypothetical protein R2755_02955 [Acidimicrobiales bacterium]